MRAIVPSLLLLGLAWLALPASAAIDPYEFATDGQREDYQILIEELRCLVCQNQNLADSNAELAQDLRRQVKEMIQAGKSRDEIVDYMVARYGDFVMYRPPVKSTTLLLWVGPFLLFGVAGGVLFNVIRKRAAAPAGPELSEAERNRAEALLRGDRDEAGTAREEQAK